MEFTCNRDNLIEGINIVQRAVPTRTTVPVLEGILLELGDELKLTGNDTELGIEYEVPAIIEEIGSIVVNSKTFGDIIRKLPDMYVTVKTIDDNVVEISSGAADYKIKTMDPESYPKVMEIESEKEYKILGTELKELIRKTIFAVSQDDMRPVLKGEFVEITGQSMNFVAIDGYKMAVKSLTREDTETSSVIVPSRILNEASRFISTPEEEVTMVLNENQIMLKAKYFVMVSRLIKGEYLNYRSMVPREFKTEVIVKCKDLMAAIERATLVMTDERKFPLVLNISGSEIIITANAEQGNSKEVVNANISGDDITLGFNSKNLLETLRAIDDLEIKISFTTNQGPCVIKSLENEEDFTYMVMPVLTRR